MMRNFKQITEDQKDGLNEEQKIKYDRLIEFQQKNGKMNEWDFDEICEGDQDVADRFVYDKDEDDRLYDEEVWEHDENWKEVIK